MVQKIQPVPRLLLTHRIVAVPLLASASTWMPCIDIIFMKRSSRIWRPTISSPNTVNHYRPRYVTSRGWCSLAGPPPSVVDETACCTLTAPLENDRNYDESSPGTSPNTNHILSLPLGNGHHTNLLMPCITICYRIHSET